MSEPQITSGAALRLWQTVRVRLLALALLPIMVILPVLLGVTGVNWSQRFDEALISKVNGELTIAHQHLAGLMETRVAALDALGRSVAFQRQIDSGNTAAMQIFLAQERVRQNLDFLYLVQGGRVFAAAPDVPLNGMIDAWPVIETALGTGSPRVEIDLFSGEDLARFGAELAARASLPLVETPAAVPTDRTIETRGLVIHAAAPAADGALVGGVLLNRNLDFIDEINELVYPAESLTEGSTGTATLFLEDVRVSTNVRMFDDERALGTRVSAAVRARVLDEGRVWLDRAFVVNDWYVSAYEPIVDSFGDRIGMLYVGFLEAPFSAAKTRTIWQVVIGFGLSLVIFVPLLLWWAGSIFRPLEKMNTTITKVEHGDLGARTGAGLGSDEIGRVASHLDELLDRLQDREQRLRDWTEELETRVADRTRDLQEANRQLKITTSQLVVSEKLAAIGEITAGVAHEINNPLAVIQGNLEVIYRELGQQADPFKTEFKLILEQIQTINVLVSKLLQFARPEEYAEDGNGLEVNSVISELRPLIQHHLNAGEVHYAVDLAATRLVPMNQTELQQVLINLTVNAVQACVPGGHITVASRDASKDGRNGIEITVTDDGCGMDAETAARVFDPFFTMKRAEGTGLGLSVSSKLVARVGGQITVDSTPGEGTVFTVWLPAS
ncbi:MAG: cache domain-containing protein [Marivivens sp.]|nr:cache domain-containing protein [Marivivens sp.]